MTDTNTSAAHLALDTAIANYGRADGVAQIADRKPAVVRAAASFIAIGKASPDPDAVDAAASLERIIALLLSAPAWTPKDTVARITMLDAGQRCNKLAAALNL